MNNIAILLALATACAVLASCQTKQDAPADCSAIPPCKAPMDTPQPRRQNTPKLQHKSEIASIRKQIDQSFQHVPPHQGRNILDYVTNQIIQLAVYDLDGAIEVFQKAHALYQADISHLNASESNYHREILLRVIKEITSNKSCDPADGLRFYKAIRKGPQGSCFGSGPADGYETYFSALGESMVNRNSPDIPKDTPHWLRPWLPASRIANDCRTDAYAAAICYNLIGRATTTADQTKKLMLQAHGYSAKSRELALACMEVNHFTRNPMDTTSTFDESFIRLINTSGFDSQTRLQIAYAAAYTNPKILVSPSIAKAFAGVFIPYCAGEFSVVDARIIHILQSMADFQPTPESVPHLRNINEAFWSNANAHKKDNHLAIEQQQAVRLLLASIRIGDFKQTKLLLQNDQPSLVGNLDVIVALVLAGHFQLACELLPDEASKYKLNYHIGISYDDALFQKLDALAEASPRPERTLLFECQLVRIFEGRGNYGMYGVKKRKPALIARYLKHKPEALARRAELLSFFIANTNPSPAELENDIFEIADRIDARQAIAQWMGDQQISAADLPAEAAKHILRAAALAQFNKGNTSIFVSQCEAITSAIEHSSEQKPNAFLPDITHNFLSYAYLAVVEAVSSNNTEAFAKIIGPLRNFALAVPRIRSDQLTYPSLALHDFVSHWDNQPEDLSAELKKWSHDDLQKSIESLEFPRKNFPLIQAMGSLRIKNPLLRVNLPESLITNILSRPSLARLFVTETPWLTNLRGIDCHDAVNTLAISPPESVTKEGRLILRFHHASGLSEAPALEAYQAILKDIPDTPMWNGIRVRCQLQATNEMIRLHHDIGEISILFDSINADQAKKTDYQVYRSVEINLESAKARNNKESP
jgi:hypothetical protein